MYNLKFNFLSQGQLESLNLDKIFLPLFSLRSKHSRTKRAKFGPRVLVFHIRDARKMGREQIGGRKGVGEGKEGNACPQTPEF